MSRCLMLQIDDTPIPLLKEQYIKNHDILFFVSSDSSPKFLNLFYIDENTQQVMHCFVRTNHNVASNEELVARELLFRGVIKEPVYQPDQNETARQQARKQYLYDCIAKHQAIFIHEASQTPTQDEELYSPKSPSQLSKTRSYASQNSLASFDNTHTEQTEQTEQIQRSQPVPIIPKGPSSPTIFKQPVQIPPLQLKKIKGADKHKKNPTGCFKCTMC